jgi:uncharacterized cupredoxin-like copper-binding protein
MLRGRFRFLAVALAALMTVALVAACSSDDDGTVPPLPEPTDAPSTPTNGETPDNGGETPAPGDLTLVMRDISFDQTELTIAAGQQVELALVNEGVLEHDISIDEIPVEYSVSGDATDGGDWDLHASLQPGTNGGITMTVSEAGTYTYYCSIVGHREAGMEGTLTVE